MTKAKYLNVKQKYREGEKNTLKEFTKLSKIFENKPSSGKFMEYGLSRKGFESTYQKYMLIFKQN